MKNGSFSHNLKAGVAQFTSARRRMLCVLSLLAALIFVGAAAASVVFVLKWGSQGTGDGQFNQPIGVALNSTGQVYVTDYLNNRIQKFDANGSFLTQWGSPGSGAGQFNGPFGVAVDSAGNVYVAELNLNNFGHGRIQKFDANGAFLSSIDNFGGDPFVPIRLPQPLSFNQNVQAIGLDDFGNQPAGQVVTLAGWGTTSDNSTITSNLLNQVQAPIITNAECANAYGSIITPGIGCTSGAGGVGACNDDGGGPVFIGNTLVGIISFTSNQCSAGYPTGFTRIAEYREWIRQNSGI